MSYLDVPRLHFSGSFRGDPSTVNNDPENFNPRVTNPDPSWNPNGAHWWQFKDCTVKTVINDAGEAKNSSAEDPVIGSPIESTDTPQTAKLVDLDTEQQTVSEVWGLRVQLGASSDTDSFAGDYRVAAFNDLWTRAAASQGDSRYSAYYQSVLDNVKWSKNIASPFLKQLKAKSPDRLSINFIVDGYQLDSTSAEFTYGRIVGTIGPALPDEPAQFVVGRLLRPAAQGSSSPALYFAQAKVDEALSTAIIDLGNSIPTVSPGGPSVDLGTLQLAVAPPAGSPVLLGSIDYSEAAYIASSLVQSFALSKDQLELVQSNPLAVVQVDSSGAIGVLLQENPTCAYLRADQFVYRLNPGETATVNLIATEFGKPKSGQKISLRFDSDMLQPAPGIPVGKPRSALEFPTSVTTDKQGRASLVLKANDPGNPRRFIDGQIYGIGYYWGDGNDPNYNPDPWNFISVRVFDSYQVRNPTWKDIKPIFDQYSKLFPFMTNIIDLADYAAVQQHAKRIEAVMSLPESDPGYMPVTRDLSRDKRNAILLWLKSGSPA